MSTRNTSRSDRSSQAAGLLICIGLCAVGLYPRDAAGQQVDPAADARFRSGPLAFTPSLTFNVGVDTNVFNQSDNPRRDVASELAPQVETWLRLGRARLSGTTGLRVVYYHQFDTERSVNANNQLLLELPLNRVRPWVSSAVLTSRERLNVEVDVRARRTEFAGTAGLDVRITPKTTIGVSAHRGRVAFGRYVLPLEFDPRETLNRNVTNVTGSLRRALTPLTTLVVLANTQNERFELSPIRDSDSLRVSPGVEFDKFALLNGRAFVGYRRFRPLSSVLPPFTGVVASADLAYTLRARTRLGFLAERDVAYSVNVTNPYYLLGALTGTLIQQLGDRWQLGTTVSRHRLTYRSVGLPASSGGTPGTPGTETAVRVGTSLGYRVGPRTTLGVSVDRYERTSVVTAGGFDGVRVNTTMTYRD